jgi:hypothetical protein
LSSIPSIHDTDLAPCSCSCACPSAAPACPSAWQCAESLLGFSLDSFMPLSRWAGIHCGGRPTGCRCLVNTISVDTRHSRARPSAEGGFMSVLESITSSGGRAIYCLLLKARYPDTLDTGQPRALLATSTSCGYAVCSRTTYSMLCCLGVWQMLSLCVYDTCTLCMKSMTGVLALLWTSLCTVAASCVTIMLGHLSFIAA